VLQSSSSYPTNSTLCGRRLLTPSCSRLYHIAPWPLQQPVRSAQRNYSEKTPTRPKLRRTLFNAPPRLPTLNNCTGCPSRGEYNTNYAASCSELTENYSPVLPFPVLCHRQPPPIDCKGTLHHSLEWPKDAWRTRRLRSQVQLVLGTVCHIHSPRVPNLPILLMPTEKLPFNARCYAERGITMACLLSVCLSVRLRRWWTGVWSHRLEFFENNFMVS